MLPPISDVTHITLAHCDAVGRGYPPHQFSVTINTLAPHGEPEYPNPPCRPRYE